MVEENISQEFWLKNEGETKNYFNKETDQNELMSEKWRKVCIDLNYIDHFHLLASAITKCVSISTVASVLGIRIGVISSAIGLKICAVTPENEKYKSIIKKKKKKYDRTVLLAKTKLNTIKVLISKALIDSNIVLMNFFWWFKRRNQKFKDLNSPSKILFYY